MNIQVNPLTDALVVIDIQNDFCPGGALAVNEGDQIIPGVAQLAKQFKTIVISQDWHPAGHASFASAHGQAPFSQMDMPYGAQTLWPDHCVQGTAGAAFHPELESLGVMDAASVVIRKGANPDVDSYSAFFENDRRTTTGLAGYLREKGIKRVFLVGLAYDFCVAYSAIDAVAQGFEATVIKDLTRAIAMPVDVGTTVDAAERSFRVAGVVVANAADVSPAPKTSPGLR